MGTGSNMAFRVVVDDNFHYMDEGERYTLGSFPTAQEAIEAARRIVDDYLVSAHRPGMTAKELFESYTSFGEDPFIVGEGSGRVVFSAWGYAKAQCAKMCGEGASNDG